MDSGMQNVNLTLIKKLVAELDMMVTASKNMPIDSADEANELIIHASKASGIATGISQEAALIVKDLYMVVTNASKAAYSAGGTNAGAVHSADDALLSMLGLSKPAKDPTGSSKN